LAYSSNLIAPPQQRGLVVRKAAVQRDDALRAGRRGARKIVVTERYPESEKPSVDFEWQPPAAGELCPVWQADSFELALFTQEANQDRHYHARGTEVYTVLDGEMSIEVEGAVHRLRSGDSIVVGPGAIHQVLRGASIFLCQVLTANCGGAGDKFLAAPGDEVPA
jgi:quercetin dioxygenase-like cupin family protein